MALLDLARRVRVSRGGGRMADTVADRRAKALADPSTRWPTVVEGLRQGWLQILPMADRWIVEGADNSRVVVPRSRIEEAR